MKDFMDEDFILTTETARRLYHEHAAKVPVIDYHCHLSPQEIAEDITFENITQLWLGGDHYKWRLMRANGVEERYITGDAPDVEKFEAFMSVLPRCIGNPMYHWCHLELKKYFGYTKTLSEKTWKEVWDLTYKKLQDPSMSAKNLIRMSDVTLVCTTDDPIDDLHWHKQIKEDTDFPVQVLPAWRPDLAMSPEKEEFVSYIERLSEVSGSPIHSFEDLKRALAIRLDYFVKNGCVVTDHGLDYAEFVKVTDAQMEDIFSRSLKKEKLTLHDLQAFRTMTMIFLGKKYAEYGLVMQLHYGARRENNKKLFSQAGANAGLDCINPDGFVSEVADFLNELSMTAELPKTVIYSLNPTDNALIGTIIGCFQGAGVRGKIQHGAAWWFNDHKPGMTDHLVTLASEGVLGNFIGMLTDSRSFISYPRHEYFRRILCDFLGELVENGEYPCDMEMLGSLVEDISYNNAVNYFGFEL